MEKTEKTKVGFYAITGCQGCLLSVLFNEDEILDIINAVDIVAFHFIKGNNSDEPMDIAFIEGTVVSEDDLEQAMKLRKRAKIVVALGACACSGNIPALRNFTKQPQPLHSESGHEKQEHIKDIGHPSPLSRHIKVDLSVPGCPPDESEIKKFIKDILLGKEFRNYPDPVCRECRLSENGCLLDYNKICLGPLTRGGCGSICPSNGLECYGCRGITDDANFSQYFDLMDKKGISATEVKKHMETFVGLEINEKLKGTKWEQLH